MAWKYPLLVTDRLIYPTGLTRKMTQWFVAVYTRSKQIAPVDPRRESA
ncbi:hypothetical protein [Fibrella arboris]